MARRSLPENASARDAVDLCPLPQDSHQMSNERHDLIEQSNLEFDIASPVTRISAKGLLEGEELSGGDYLPVGGYAGIINTWEGLDIRTKQVVQKISQVKMVLRFIEEAILGISRHCYRTTWCIKI